MPFIMVAVLIDMLSIGLIVPVLPALVGTFVPDPAMHAFWYGAVVFAFGIANFFGAPIMGALSDRFGRRPVMLLGFCGLALNLFATALASALWMLVAVRLVGGFFQANASVANAYVADITLPAERARRFGLLGAMFGIGFILGPVIGGLLGAIDLHWPFYAAGTLALLNLAYGALVLPESLPPERRRPFEWRRANPVASLRELRAITGAGAGGMGSLVGTIALVAFAQFTLYTTWVLYTTFKFGWGPEENGWSLFVVGLVAVLVQGGLMGRLIRVLGQRRLLLWGLVSSTLAYLGWGLAPAGWVMFVVVVANLLGGTVQPTLNALVSSAAAADVQGRAMGAVSALGSAMAALAPLVGAPLLALVSHHPPGDWRIGAPFFFCALLQGLALWLAWRHFRTAPPPPALATQPR
jgi:DHA1 family tetracycline resistance protein-like MFS transporter